MSILSSLSKLKDTVSSHAKEYVDSLQREATELSNELKWEAPAFDRILPPSVQGLVGSSSAASSDEAGADFVEVREAVLGEEGTEQRTQSVPPGGPSTTGDAKEPSTVIGKWEECELSPGGAGAKDSSASNSSTWEILEDGTPKFHTFGTAVSAANSETSVADPLPSGNTSSQGKSWKEKSSSSEAEAILRRDFETRVAALQAAEDTYMDPVSGDEEDDMEDRISHWQAHPVVQAMFQKLVVEDSLSVLEKDEFWRRYLHRYSLLEKEHEALLALAQRQS